MDSAIVNKRRGKTADRRKHSTKQAYECVSTRLHFKCTPSKLIHKCIMDKRCEPPISLSNRTLMVTRTFIKLSYKLGVTHVLNNIRDVLHYTR